MISERRITADDYMTKPMHIKMCRNIRIFRAIFGIVSIFITLAISSAVTMILHWFLEPSLYELYKHIETALNFFDLGNYIPSSISNIFIPTENKDKIAEFFGTLFIPVYLIAMLSNIMITGVIIFVYLEIAFSSSKEYAEPYEYKSNTIDESN